MFLKMVRSYPRSAKAGEMNFTLEVRENENHIVEGDHFFWGWRKEWPEEYWLPFSIADEKNEGNIMVVEVYRDGQLAESIVAFEATCYIMSDNGKTIDKFTA